MTEEQTEEHKKKVDETTEILMAMLKSASNKGYNESMQAGVMYLIAKCMEGGATLDDRDAALQAFMESFMHNWRIAFSVQQTLVGEAGHA